MRITASSLLPALALGLALAGTAAASGIESRALQFAKGASSATVKGEVKGEKTIDYRVRARAGQTMSVTLQASHGANYFNVLPPGSSDVAIFNSSLDGNDWTGTLPADGEYKIRVYLMRSAARRNEVSNYALTVGITGRPSATAAKAVAPAGDAKVKGTPFHATGMVRCAMGNAPPASQSCDFGVIRGKAGDAEVHLTPPGGLKRVLKFAGAKVSSDGAMSVKAAKQGDTWSIEVNEYEHYQVPEAVISGG